MIDEDVAAFCRRLHPVLLGGLTLHCRDRSVAEEVTQETLVRVWERWPSLDPARGSRDAWAWRVALNRTASRTSGAASVVWLAEEPRSGGGSGSQIPTRGLHERAFPLDS
jgi:DNA-directed RNA polymerase specialized sigma24 family protein